METKFKLRDHKKSEQLIQCNVLSKTAQILSENILKNNKARSLETRKSYKKTTAI